MGALGFGNPNIYYVIWGDLFPCRTFGTFHAMGEHLQTEEAIDMRGDGDYIVK